MAITRIASADDLAALAREALDRVWIDKRFVDLISAVLMANHIADWHFQVDLGRAFYDGAKAEMKAAYPAWDTIRQLANGTKHCKLDAPVQAQQSNLEWEHHDFWGSPGHVNSDGLDWFVEHDGKQRSVAILIKTFLDEFENFPTRPT